MFNKITNKKGENLYIFTAVYTNIKPYTKVYTTIEPLYTQSWE